MKRIANALRLNQFLKALVLAPIASGPNLFPSHVHANPTGAEVVAGNVNFDGMGTAALDINNLSQRAIIDWQTFSIGENEITTIHQSASAHTLNRVESSSPSEIYGLLKAANGGVTVINRNGIMVGEGGRVDIAGLLTMSTLDVSNNEFLEGGAKHYQGDTSAGIENYGSITSTNGDVILLGNFLQNAGSVSAPDGNVAFGAGGDMIVDQAGGGIISVRSGGREAETGIENTGSINGAGVDLQAHGNVYALAIKNDGLVRASGYNFKGGKLTLSGGANGRIVNNGHLQARNRDGSGGQLEIAGGRVQFAAGSSVDASAELGRNGGSVNVSGGDVIIEAAATVTASGASDGSIRISGASSASVNGSLEAIGDMGRGGKIDVEAESVVIGSTASVNASGLTGGGQIRIGGGFHGKDTEVANSQQTTVEQGALIIADGEEFDGGRVVVWSDGGTLFDGEISAQALGSLGNGGFVEVSGRQSLQIGAASVSTASVGGMGGTLLIDPVNVSVSAVGGGGTITDAFLRNSVEAGNVIIHTNGGNPGDTGSLNIFSGAKIIYSSPNSLTFLSDGDIHVDGDIKNIGTVDTTLRSVTLNDTAGTGHINLVAGWDGSLPAVLSGNVDSLDFLNPDGSPNFTGDFGSWGAAGSSIFFNDAGFESVEVGSARGETNIFADVIQLRHGRADGRFSQIGYRRVADIRDTWVAPGDPGDFKDTGFGGYFDNPDDQIVDGDINVYGLSAVLMRPSDETNTSDFNKIRNFGYTMIGHGGVRNNQNSVDARAGTAFGYDSGVTAVDDGSNSGDITVHAGTALVMQNSRLQGQTQIGHGGVGISTPDAGNIRVAGGAYPALGTIILGDMSGDILVEAGTIDMEAGLFSDVPVQIGHGGINVRGEFSGDITVTSTIGGISGTAAPVLGHTNSDNNRDRSYVQIGHGGSGSFHPLALPVRNGVQLLTSSDAGVVAVNNTSAPGDGININPDTGLPYGHKGDISVVSAAGIHMTASGNLAHAMIGHGGQASHGDHRGDIHVEAKAGDVIFDRIAVQLDVLGRDRRQVGAAAFVQVGHGGRRSSGGGTGNIDVLSTGDIEFYGGRSEAFAQIGHGGRGDDSTTTNVNAHRGTTRASGTHTGDINVVAGGNIKFRSGFGSGGTAYSMIGHGGYLNHADIYGPDSVQLNGLPVGGGASRILTDVDGNPVLTFDGKYQLVDDKTQQGHNGDIFVRAGGSIDFQAGQTEILPGQEPFGIEMNRNDNYTMIGNGGRSSWGDHWGAITVLAETGDITFEARGGWDGISYEGANEGPASLAAASAAARGVPRLSADEDNVSPGLRSFAMIGNGGWDANHRIQSSFVKTDATGAVAIGPLMEFTGVATTDVFTTGVNHNLAEGDTITVQGIGGGGGLSVNNTVYFIRNPTATTFQISTTLGGTPLNLTSNLVNNSRDHSGTMGAGIGTWGPSDISVSALLGDVTFKAAQVDTIGVGFIERAFLARNTTGTVLNEIDENGNPVSVQNLDYFYRNVKGEVTYLSATVGQHVWHPTLVNRSEAVYNGTVLSVGRSLGDANIDVNILAANANTTLDNRLVVPAGHAFVGGEGVVFDDNGGTAILPTGIVAGQIYYVYSGGTGATAIHNPRYNENDFKLTTLLRSNNTAGLIDFADTGSGWTLRQTWNGWEADAPVPAAQDAFAQIGNGGRSTHYLGGDGNLRGLSDGLGHRGNITVEAGGSVAMFASDIDPWISSRQWTTIRRIAYDGSPLLGGPTIGSAPDVNFDILVGPGAPNGAVGPTTNTMVGRNFGTSGTDTRSQLNPSFRLYNYAMIGNGGWSAIGDHQGDIRITAGLNSATGGLTIQGGEGREEFAQIGNGGFDSDGFDPLGGRNTDNNRDNDTGSSGDITVNVAGGITVQGGGVNTKVVGITGTTTDTATTAVTNGGLILGGLAATDEDRYSYAQIGNGGGAVGGTHSGDITLISSGGGLDVIAGKNSQIAYAQVGNGGFGSRGEEHNGDIFIRVAGDINVRAGNPFIDDGNYTLPGGAPSTTGQIAHARTSYAQIGHGGYDSDPQGGNLNLAQGVGGFSGRIDLISSNGSLTLQGGGDPTLTRNDDTYFRSLYAQVGHGGNWTDGDHSGDIQVSVTQDVTINGGASGREAYAQIGHGGVQVGVTGAHNGGNLSGDIEVIVGNNLTINRGANVDSSPGGSTNRAGLELFNNYAKIGHGDDVFRQRIASLGERNGDIHISVGNTINLADPDNRPFADAAYSAVFGASFPDRILIGHMNSRLGLQDAFRSTSGDTYIAVSRDFPYQGGTGQVITHDGTVITSSREGVSSEVRLYMPEASNNQIATGTFINNANYTRTPAPGSGREDEQIATGHEFTTGAFGELKADFITPPATDPEGAYPFQSFGLYNVYYAELAPAPEPPPTPDTDFIGFDSFDRDDGFFSYDGYEEMLLSLALGDAMEEDGGSSTGPVAFEEWLDDSLGSRRAGRNGFDGSALEDEEDEEKRRRKRYADRKVGMVGLTYYVYDPGTNRFSSYRVFGVPQTKLSVTQ